MKETKFHKMEKEIAALKQEIAELRTQINLLAARVPFIYYYVQTETGSPIKDAQC